MIYSSIITASKVARDPTSRNSNSRFLPLLLQSITQWKSYAVVLLVKLSTETFVCNNCNPNNGNLKVNKLTSITPDFSRRGSLLPIWHRIVLEKVHQKPPWTLTIVRFFQRTAAALQGPAPWANCCNGLATVKRHSQLNQYTLPVQNHRKGTFCFFHFCPNTWT